MTSFTGRMIGAASFDARVFEEIEADTGATGQALLVVALTGVAAAIGSLRFGVTATLTALVAATVGWVVFAGLIYVIGTQIMPGPKTDADLGQLLRVLGFAASPALLQVLGIIPCVGPLIAIATWFWTLGATVVGVRHALDHDGYGRTIVVCLIGWFVWLVLRTAAMAFGAGAAFFGSSIWR